MPIINELVDFVAFSISSNFTDPIWFSNIDVKYAIYRFKTYRFEIICLFKTRFFGSRDMLVHVYLDDTFIATRGSQEHL